MPASPFPVLRARIGALDAKGRAFALGLLSLLPLVVWWLGWFPGFVSSDSVDQLGQVRRGGLSNQHPAFHTMAMWLVMRVWDHPGAITLVQVIAMSVVLAYTARRLAEHGVRPWLAGGSVIAIAFLPAVGITTIALWKDVPFTLALLWALAEVLGLAADPSRCDRRWPLIRLGAALALVWLFRHNGFITVVLFGAVMTAWLHRRPRALLALAAPLVAIVAIVNLVLYPLAGVDRASIQPATVFISDVAASYVHRPEVFSSDEVGYLTSMAPPDVWRELYDCRDSTPLVFSDRFDTTVITTDPGRFRSLVVATYLRDPLTVMGHRWCVSSFLFVPPQPSDSYFHRPPFEIHPNDLGIERAPISERAHRLTRAIFTWAEPDGRLWLTWRPALAVWGAAIAVAVLAWRRRLTDGLWLAPTLIGAQIVNLVITTPAQEFRFAFGVYVACLLTLPLLDAAHTGRPRTPAAMTVP